MGGKYGKNFIPEVCEKLGLKIGEEFKISAISSPHRLRFREDGLEVREDGHDLWVNCISALLQHLITGDVKIIKLQTNGNMLRNLTNEKLAEYIVAERYSRSKISMEFYRQECAEVTEWLEEEYRGA